MKPIERVLTAMQGKEPDRVPFFLLLTLHGAKMLGISTREYFSRPDCVAEAQIRFQKRYRHDCLYMFYFAALEYEAWGGEVLYPDNSPPNAGAPIVRNPDAILRLSAPRVSESPGLQRALKSIELSKIRNRGNALVIGVVISPFSLPVMQLGFELYIKVLFEHPDVFKHLMRINEAFCAEWGRAQLAAGADVICYFDPVSSPSMVPCSDFLTKGSEVARRMKTAINGPMAIHLASGRSIPILKPLAQLGFSAVGVSADEDLVQLKNTAAGKITLMGNLNGITMRDWTADQAQSIVRDCIRKAAPGGGYILSDNHGEIPPHVPDEVLMAISDAVHRWGGYPLKWTEGNEA